MSKATSVKFSAAIDKAHSNYIRVSLHSNSKPKKVLSTKKVKIAGGMITHTFKHNFIAGESYFVKME